MTEIKKYQTKPDVFEAVLYKYPLSDEVRQWLGENYITEIKEKHPSVIGWLIFKSFGYDKEVNEGNYIIKDQRGNVYSVESEEFQRLFREFHTGGYRMTDEEFQKHYSSCWDDVNF